MVGNNSPCPHLNMSANIGIHEHDVSMYSNYMQAKKICREGKRLTNSMELKNAKSFSATRISYCFKGYQPTKEKIILKRET